MSEPLFRTMQPEEEPAVLDLLETAFGVRFIFEGYCRHDPAFRPDDFLLAVEGGRPVACVQIFTKRVRLAGGEVLLGGIGSVATAPSHRRRGLSSRLLVRSIEEMRRRGMALSLLFSSLFSFYQRLGWVSVPQARIAFHAARDRVGQIGAGARIRPFDPSDRGSVERLYARYSGSLDSSTLRDPPYWDGQLRYAGNPDEEFRVAERDGRITAYARGVRLYGMPLAMEYAREPQAAGDLAALLADLAPAGAALVLPWAEDEDLFESLRSLATRLDRFEDPGLMWRVLDGSRLAGLAGWSGAEPDDGARLRSLVGSPRALYWPSDRF